jgi:hypothetical protein
MSRHGDVGLTGHRNGGTRCLRGSDGSGIGKWSLSLGSKGSWYHSVKLAEQTLRLRIWIWIKGLMRWGFVVFVETEVLDNA